MEFKQLEGIKRVNNNNNVKTGLLFVFGVMPTYNYYMMKGSKLVNYEFKDYKELIIIDCSISQTYSKIWSQSSAKEKRVKIFMSYIASKGVDLTNPIYPHIQKEMLIEISDAITVAEVLELPIFSLEKNEQKRICYNQIISELIKSGLISDLGRVIPDLKKELNSFIIRVPENSKKQIIPLCFIRIGGDTIVSIEQLTKYISDHYWLYYSGEEIIYYSDFWKLAIESYLTAIPSYKQGILLWLNSFNFFRPTIFESSKSGFPIFYSIDGLEFDKPILHSEETSLRTYYNVFKLSNNSYFSLFGSIPPEDYVFKVGNIKFKDTAILKLYSAGNISVTYNDSPVEIFGTDLKATPSVTCYFGNDLTIFPSSSVRKIIYRTESYKILSAFVIDIDEDSVVNSIINTIFISEPLKNFYNLLKAKGTLTFLEVDNLGLKRKDLLSLSLVFKFYMITQTGYKFWFTT